MFLRSPLAAWFHIKLPLKWTKCSLRQPNLFFKFSGEDAPGPPLKTCTITVPEIAPSAHLYTLPPYKILPMGLIDMFIGVGSITMAGVFSILLQYKNAHTSVTVWEVLVAQRGSGGGGGAWYFRPRGGSGNFIPIAREGRIIFNAQFKISTLPC